ncbi:helix-turn-helix domain-containing protein [Parapedobacter sp. 2B3]|uniref:helix-turn-helix domain-containing protein n=1 Tax=Parapedobacter sp. 2B3 TaxID=3342381 RepID=UPI0035B5D39A
MNLMTENQIEIYQGSDGKTLVEVKFEDDTIWLTQAQMVAHMSPNAFSRYFKSQTQKTFSNFVNEVRIGHACKLLQPIELTVAQVCYECGFNSMTNFIKFFRKSTHKTPLQYHKEQFIYRGLQVST